VKSKIIVALDFSDSRTALAFVDQLTPDACRLKVGKELFMVGGPKLVENLVGRGFSIFLDLKFHDIPNTVAKACTNASKLGVWMINVHAMGGPEMLDAARKSIPKEPGAPLLIAVTALTSLDQSNLLDIGFSEQLENVVLKLTQMARRYNCDGVVCSAREAGFIRNKFGSDFLRITPGIRLPGDSPNEQKRVMDPINAIKQGASFLVIGRSITQSSNPMEIIDKINREIG